MTGSKRKLPVIPALVLFQKITLIGLLIELFHTSPSHREDGVLEFFERLGRQVGLSENELHDLSGRIGGNIRGDRCILLILLLV